MKSKKFHLEKEFLDYWEPYFQKVADLQYLLFSQPPDIDVNEFIKLVPNYLFFITFQFSNFHHVLIFMYFIAF